MPAIVTTPSLHPAPLESVRETLDTWALGWGVWGDYLNRLVVATGPLSVYEAGTRLMTDSLDICSRTAAARLRAGGVRTPLLNDA